MPGTRAERHAGRGQGQRLFATAPEQARIATLEAADLEALAGKLDESARNIGLARRGLAAALSGVDVLGLGAGQGQHRLAHQGVVDHRVGLAKRVQGKQGQEARVARSGAHQPYRTRREPGHLQGYVDHAAKGTPKA